MITIKDLDVLVGLEFGSLSGWKLTAKEWEKIRTTLETRIEPEYIDDEHVELVEVKGYSETYDEDLAYFLWRCGCNLTTAWDYIDGSPICTVSLPNNEEEYWINIKEAYAWWKEVE